MKFAVGFICFILLPFCFPFIALSQNQHITKNTASRYYTLNDFYSVKKFDTHIHLNTYQGIFIK